MLLASSINAVVIQQKGSMRKLCWRQVDEDALSLRLTSMNWSLQTFFAFPKKYGKYKIEYYNTFALTWREMTEKRLFRIHERQKHYLQK